ncbi:MAG: transcriptional repressor [Candidatus Portnoybacteria bacterium]|nr:transcriptional repressor [Candidatus Portnoybacteria bacterium]
MNTLGQKRHARVEDIFGALKNEHPLMSLATIYRNLKTLERKGEVTGFLHPDGAARYELRGNSIHQHLVCEACGAIREVELGFLEELSQNIKKRAGFTIHTHRLSMVGRCDGCKVVT